jgi:prepilin-type N-terminal cleavage/methylation domain-containing protein/prepilin-type processing-associated H-X9-DG protein
MKRTSSGFTLVELLVVITIIGILAGLLLPAVQRAREAARAAQCSTQLKNLALAAIQYENTKGEFPGWEMNFGTYQGGGDPSDPDAGPTAPHAKIGTWAVALLPYLDAQPTYEHWTEDKYPIVGDGSQDNQQTNEPNGAGVGFLPNAAPNLAIMQCPSSPTLKGSQGINSYISNNGLYVDLSGANDPDVVLSSSMKKANGVFNNKAFNAVNGPSVSLDDLKDGPGNTALFSENLQALPWHRAGFINRADLESAPLGYVPSSRLTQGMVWHPFDPEVTPSMGPAQEIAKINGGTTAQDRYALEMLPGNANNPLMARPSSAHIDGVNVGFADGAVRYITSNIDYRVYQAILTTRGKSSDVPFSEFVLSGEEF